MQNPFRINWLLLTLATLSLGALPLAAQVVENTTASSNLPPAADSASEASTLSGTSNPAPVVVSPDSIATSTLPETSTSAAPEVKAVAEKEEFQKPISLSPGLGLGWGWSLDNFFIINPSLELAINTKSSTKRDVSFSLSYDFTLKEYVGETAVLDGVYSTDNLRNLTQVGALSFSTQMTEQVKYSLTVTGVYDFLNAYESAGDEIFKASVTNALSFTGPSNTSMKNTTLGLGVDGVYVYFVNSTVNSNQGLGIQTEEGILYGISTTDSAYVDYANYISESDPGYLTAKADYNVNPNISISQKFDNPMAPSANLKYTLARKVSTIPDGTRDLIGHTVNPSLTQPLWTGGSLNISYKLGINNYDWKIADDGLYYRQDILHVVSATLSQTINDFLSMEGAFGYENNFSNFADAIAEGKEVSVMLKAAF